MFTGVFLPGALPGEQGTQADTQHHRDKDGEEEKGNAIAALVEVSLGQGLVISSPVIGRGGSVRFHSLVCHRLGVGEMWMRSDVLRLGADGECSSGQKRC